MRGQAWLFDPQTVWVPCLGSDPRLWAFKRRHYSSAIRGRLATYLDRDPAGTVGGPGETLALITPDETACFVWVMGDPEYRRDGVDGPLCTMFRNEGKALSSHLIQAAEVWAWSQDDWWHRDLYTYVSPSHIRSKNPGCCFKKAGWKFDCFTTSGLWRFKKRRFPFPVVCYNIPHAKETYKT